MRILIIDDEAGFRRALKERLVSFFEKEGTAVEIEDCGNPASVREQGLYKRCDLILLDIEMPAMSGMSLASYINENRGGSEKPYLIFVTNREGLVFDALKLQPYSFIRKDHLEDIEPCLRRILDKLKNEDFIVIHSGRGTQRLSLGEILYLEKSKNYVVYHTERGEFRERTTIDEKERSLSDKGFLRPHIGYLVNAGYIDSVMPKTVTLTNGEAIPVNRRFYNDLRQKHFEWMVNLP